MNYRRIYLDTNVLVLAFEGDASNEVAAGIVGALGHGASPPHPAFVTSELALAEILVHPYRHRDSLAVSRYTLLLGSSAPWLQVVPVSRAILMSSAQLRAQTRLKLADAIHVASGLSTGCSHILTSDTDMGDSVALDTRRIQTIRPTVAVLDDIVAWLRT